MAGRGAGVFLESGEDYLGADVEPPIEPPVEAAGPSEPVGWQATARLGISEARSPDESVPFVTAQFAPGAPARLRRVRRLVPGLLTAGLLGLGAVLLVALFSDRSTTGPDPASSASGSTAASDPAGAGALADRVADAAGAGTTPGDGPSTTEATTGSSSSATSPTTVDGNTVTTVTSAAPSTVEDPASSATTTTNTTAGPANTASTVTTSAPATTTSTAGPATTARDRIGAPLRLLSVGSQRSSVGVSESVFFPVEGGSLDPILFESQGLPPGLSIDPVTGEVSGTPTSPGVYSVSITVSQPGRVYSQGFTWVVDA